MLSGRPRDLRRFVVAFIAAAVAAATAARPSAQERPGLDVLLARVGDYTARFIEHFSNVVAEEHYNYSQTGVTVAPWRSRRLVSDLLLVRLAASADWSVFRDVLEVDGLPVRNRDERLARLFLESPGTALEQATRINHEGARYNFVSGTYNNPLLALAFAQKHYQGRFRFSVKDVDKDMGPDVWVLTYRERARPTILREGEPGHDRDLPVSGRLWINGRDGRIMKTEVLVRTSNLDRYTTSFAFDENLQVEVPTEMREEVDGKGWRVTAVATYSRFRRFTVSTQENIR